MKVAKRKDQLCCPNSHQRLAKASMLPEMVVEVSTWNVVHHHVKFFTGLECMAKANHIGMPNFLEHPTFSLYLYGMDV
eukprot:SAG31_NODE_824_length_11760_cov_17.390790_6_plen_78_part_00